MDPTAPNDNGQNPQSGNPQTPIQAGQFVVAGEDAPQPAPTENPATPKVSLAGERQPQTMPQTPNAVASGTTQPDPTPFTPPGSSPTPSAQDAGQLAQQAPKTGGGSKTILIILAVLVLLAILAAVAYFFVLPMLNKQKTSTTDEQVVETSPPIQRTDTDPGFGEIPESTTSSEDTGLPPDTGETVVEDPTVDPLTTPAQ